MNEGVLRDWMYPESCGAGAAKPTKSATTESPMQTAIQNWRITSGAARVGGADDTERATRDGPTVSGGVVVVVSARLVLQTNSANVTLVSVTDGPPSASPDTPFRPCRAAGESGRR